MEELKEYEEQVLSADERAKELEYELFLELRDLVALVSNTTNDYSIALLLGRSPSTWAGKRIVLSPASSSFGKDTVPCIRVTDSPDAPEARRKLLTGIRTANPDTKPVLLGRALKLALAAADPRKAATKEGK